MAAQQASNHAGRPFFFEERDAPAPLLMTDTERYLLDMKCVTLAMSPPARRQARHA